MKILTIIILTLCPLLLFATNQERDILKFEGSDYETSIFPLEESPIRKKAPQTHPIPDNYEPPIQFRTNPSSGTSTGNYRGYIATWEIRENKLYLVNVDGWVEQYSHSEKEYLSDQKEYPRPFRIKKFYTYQRATLELLFPHEVADGKVFASWFSAEIITGGWSPAFNLSAERLEIQRKNAKLIFHITDGNVESVIDRRNPNQALQPTVKTPVESGNEQGTAAEI